MPDDPAFHDGGRTAPVTRLLACATALLLVLGGAAVADAGTVLGDSGNNRLTGTNRTDVVRGGLGDDRIDGRGGNDTIAGGGGDDRIVGGDGRDIVNGGNGNDVIDVQDGEVDRVVCGESRGDRDVVKVDRRDGVDADCEDVRR